MPPEKEPDSAPSLLSLGRGTAHGDTDSLKTQQLSIAEMEIWSKYYSL
jgi:hypothetical protein